MLEIIITVTTKYYLWVVVTITNIMIFNMSKKKTLKEYQNEFESMRPYLKGQLKEVAKRSCLHYQTVINYTNGFGNVLETWEKINNASRSIIEEIKQRFNEVML